MATISLRREKAALERTRSAVQARLSWQVLPYRPTSKQPFLALRVTKFGLFRNDLREGFPLTDSWPALGGLYDPLLSRFTEVFEA